MSSSQEQLRLLDIIEYVDNAIEYVGEMSVEQLSADRKTLAAVERCLQCVTEAAIRIGEERMHEIAPFVPLSELRGLGNRLRHSYEDIDTGLIHHIVKRDLTPLREAAARAVES